MVLSSLRWGFLGGFFFFCCGGGGGLVFFLVGGGVWGVGGFLGGFS